MSGPRLRLVLFGSGAPAACAAFEALAPHADLAAVVVPVSPVRFARLARLGWRRRRNALARAAVARDISVLECPRRGQDALAGRLRALAPDLLVVATFPCLLEPTLLAVPRLGAINLHPSLLPRHRGPDPIFWTYVHDDAEAGVTVHWMDAGADTGPVLVQEAVPLARGRPAPGLYEELSARGSALLVRAVAAIAAGTAPRIAQDERRATRERRPDAVARRLEFAAWSAERAWHVLAGLGSRWGSLLHDADGRPLPHGPAHGFTRESGHRPAGTVERDGSQWRLHCADGVVTVAREP